MSSKGSSSYFEKLNGRDLSENSDLKNFARHPRRREREREREREGVGIFLRKRKSEGVGSKENLRAENSILDMCRIVL